MDSKLIDGINKQVYQKFPDFKGVSPAISSRPEDQMLFVYKTVSTTADGHAIQRTVRVVANGSGKILKMTTSK